LQKLSISFAFKPSSGSTLEHNNREFIAKNVVREKTSDNIFYRREPVEKFYDEIFGEALAAYNARQTRGDRKIPSYFDHIKNGKQEKPWYEIVVQFGDRDTAGCGTPSGILAREMLDEYMKNFECRNPNLKVFNAVMHLDEASPHLHIDFVPAAKNDNPKRGLPIVNSMSRALEQQGVAKFGGKNEGEIWFEIEKNFMEEILRRRNISKDEKNVTHDHLSVEDYKKMKDAEALRQEIDLQKISAEEIIRLKISEQTLAKNLRNAEQKLQSGFVFKEIADEEKLRQVADGLQKIGVPFVEDAAGLHVPSWAEEKFAALEKSSGPAATSENWRRNLKLLIDRLIYKSENLDGLLQMIKSCGYDVNHENRKYVSVKPRAGNFRAVRLKTLGGDYAEENLRRRIAEKNNFLAAENERSKNLQGLERVYSRHILATTVLVYKFVKIPRKWHTARPYSIENDFHINRLVSQLNTIAKGKITSEHDLILRIEKLQTEAEANPKSAEFQQKLHTLLEIRKTLDELKNKNYYEKITEKTQKTVDKFKKM
jgi:hypothetical protein